MTNTCFMKVMETDCFVDDGLLFDNANENSRASVQITVRLIEVTSLLYLQHTVVSTI